MTTRSTRATRAALPPRLGSLAEGAAIPGVTTKTIRRWIAQGRLTGYRVGPRLLRVDLDEVESLIHRLPTVRSW